MSTMDKRFLPSLLDGTSPIPERAEENEERKRNGSPFLVVQERRRQCHHQCVHQLRAHEDNLCLNRGRVERLVLLEYPQRSHDPQDYPVHRVVWTRGEPSEAGLDVRIGVELGL